MRDPVRVSIVIPAYDSHATLRGCLEAIGRQSFRDFELIIVDSGPSDLGEGIARTSFPWVRFERATARLLPHQARNRGVATSSGELLVFTDPDIYPEGDWLACLVAAHRESDGIVVGSLACHGRRWLDMGMHLAKFDLWLPAGRPGPAELAPTANQMCPRRIFDEVGGIPDDLMIGDTLFSWRVAARGHRITFEPRAVVSHHHQSTWSQLLWERYGRGAEFGKLRLEQGAWNRGRILLHLLLSVVPVRWIRLVVRTMRNAWLAGMLRAALSTIPIIMTAHAAWLAGESRAYVSALQRRS